MNRLRSISRMSCGGAAVLAMLVGLVATGRRGVAAGNSPSGVPIPATGTPTRYALRPVRSYYWPNCESFAIHPSGKSAAIAIADGRGGTTVYLTELASKSGARTKLAYLPAIISMSVNAMCWSSSGRHLAICADGILAVVDTAPLTGGAPVVRTCVGSWIHPIFFPDERLLVGAATNAAQTGDEIQEVDPSAATLKPTVLKDIPFTYWDAFPLVAQDAETISVVGTKMRLRSDGTHFSGPEWGENSLYGITAGPFLLQNRPCFVDVRQASKPHGPHSIFEVYETDLGIYALNGQHVAGIPWPKDQRIDSIQPLNDGQVFVTLTGDWQRKSATVREFRLEPVGGATGRTH